MNKIRVTFLGIVMIVVCLLAGCGNDTKVEEMNNNVEKVQNNSMEEIINNHNTEVVEEPNDKIVINEIENLASAKIMAI